MPRDYSAKDLAVAEQLFGEDDATDWAYAFQYADGFDIDDVAVVHAFANGSNEGDPWIAVLLLDDGRWAYLSAGCDYTGWSCQAWGESHTTDSLTDLMLGFVGDEDAERLCMDMPPAGVKMKTTRLIAAFSDTTMPAVARAINDTVDEHADDHPGLEYDIDIVTDVVKGHGVYLIMFRGTKTLGKEIADRIWPQIRKATPGVRSFDKKPTAADWM